MRCNYSGEDFDVTQSIARTLTDQDRAAGRWAPEFGYSITNWNIAEKAIRDAPWNATPDDCRKLAQERYAESLKNVS